MDDSYSYSYYGVPRVLHSDQSRNFEEDLMRQLCWLYNITKNWTTAYHPEGNGQCERFNCTLHDLLCLLPLDQKCKWPRALPHILFVYNTTQHISTGHYPVELIFGQKMQLPVDFLLGKVDEDIDTDNVMTGCNGTRRASKSCMRSPGMT